MNEIINNNSSGSSMFGYTPTQQIATSVLPTTSANVSKASESIKGLMSMVEGYTKVKKKQNEAELEADVIESTTKFRELTANYYKGKSETWTGEQQQAHMDNYLKQVQELAKNTRFIETEQDILKKMDTVFTYNQNAIEKQQQQDTRILADETLLSAFITFGGNSETTQNAISRLKEIGATNEEITNSIATAIKIETGQSLNANSTFEDIKTFKKHLETYAKDRPELLDSPDYTTAMNAVTSFENGKKQEALKTLSLSIQTGNAGEVEENLNKALEMGAISKEEGKLHQTLFNQTVEKKEHAYNIAVLNQSLNQPSESFNSFKAETTLNNAFKSGAVTSEQFVYYWDKIQGKVKDKRDTQLKNIHSSALKSGSVEAVEKSFLDLELNEVYSKEEIAQMRETFEIQTGKKLRKAEELASTKNYKHMLKYGTEEQIKEALLEAVSKGSLTSEQADAVLANRGLKAAVKLQTKEDKDAYKNFSIMRDNGTEEQFKKALEQTVKRGIHTQEQADTLLKTFQTTASTKLNKKEVAEARKNLDILLKNGGTPTDIDEAYQKLVDLKYYTQEQVTLMKNSHHMEMLAKTVTKEQKGAKELYETAKYARSEKDLQVAYEALERTGVFTKEQIEVLKQGDELFIQRSEESSKRFNTNPKITASQMKEAILASLEQENSTNYINLDVLENANEKSAYKTHYTRLIQRMIADPNNFDIKDISRMVNNNGDLVNKQLSIAMTDIYTELFNASRNPKITKEALSGNISHLVTGLEMWEGVGALDSKSREKFFQLRALANSNIDPHKALEIMQNPTRKELMAEFNSDKNKDKTLQEIVPIFSTDYSSASELYNMMRALGADEDGSWEVVESTYGRLELDNLQVTRQLTDHLNVTPDREEAFRVVLAEVASSYFKGNDSQISAMTTMLEDGEDVHIDYYNDELVIKTANSSIYLNLTKQQVLKMKEAMNRVRQGVLIEEERGNEYIDPKTGITHRANPKP